MEDKLDFIIENIENFLPHGSGFNSDYEVIHDGTGIITIESSYQVISEMGFNDGFIDFVVNVPFKDFTDFSLKIVKKNICDDSEFCSDSWLDFANDSFYESLSMAQGELNK